MLRALIWFAASSSLLLFSILVIWQASGLMETVTLPLRGISVLKAVDSRVPAAESRMSLPLDASLTSAVTKFVSPRKSATKRQVGRS